MRQTFAPGAPTVRRTARRPLSGIAGLALLLPALLGGCDAIYDDTKGWAGRLEASILKTAHEMAEPNPEAAPEASPAPDAAAGTQPETAAPPAVPVEPVDTAALDAPELQPSLAPPADTPQGVTGHAPEGVMAAASDALLTGQAMAPAGPAAAMPPQTQAAMPPKPEAKPEMPAAAQAPAPAATPAAEADAAHAMVLHLSSLRSEEAAKREWSDLQHSFPEPLGQMHAEFRRTELGDKGTFYRVLAGPLPSRQEAKQVCAALKAKDAKQYCRILPSKPKA